MLLWDLGRCHARLPLFCDMGWDSLDLAMLGDGRIHKLWRKESCTKCFLISAIVSV